MKVLASGDRDWNDIRFVDWVIGGLVANYSPITLIEGEALGLDIQARVVAQKRKAKVKPFPADWEKYGKAAGPIRNQQMLDEDPDVTLAFHDQIWESHGTWDMVNRSNNKGTPTYLLMRLTDSNLAALSGFREILMDWYWVEGKKRKNGKEVWIPLYCARDEIGANAIIRMIERADPKVKGEDEKATARLRAEVKTIDGYSDFRVAPPVLKPKKKRANAQRGNSVHAGAACQECGSRQLTPKKKKDGERGFRCEQGHWTPRTSGEAAPVASKPSKASTRPSHTRKGKKKAQKAS